MKSDVHKLDIDKTKKCTKWFKSKLDKLDVDKLVPVPFDLSKLSDIVKNNVVKKNVYKAKIKNIEDKVPDITKLATNTTLNTKMNEVKGEIPSINKLTSTAALTTVENRIPNVSNLVKKCNYNKNINKIEKKITDHDHSNKCIINLEFKILTSENFTARLKQLNLAAKKVLLV